MYAFLLIQEMKKHALESNERVILYSPVKLDGELAVLPEGWEEKTVSWSTKKSWLPVGWMQGRMSTELFFHPPSVLFVPSQGLPRRFPFASYPIVTTIHDLGFLRRPDLYDPASRRRLVNFTKRSVHEASHVLTVSEFSKTEIEYFYKTPEQKISVTPLASNAEVYKLLSAPEIASVLERLRLSRNFFLSVGRLDQKKNIETIIQAFEQFKSGRGVGDPFELVLIGEPGFGFSRMQKRIELSEYKEQIRLLGYVPDADVAACMNAAVAFLFPSWYEGFGIPNLDALACGTPLITSDIPVHHEIVSDAALFVTPEKPDAWAHAMHKIVEDIDFKQGLIQKGFDQAQKFSWEKTAEKTWEVLRNQIES